MATAVGQVVCFKTATDWIPAVIVKAYSDTDGTEVANVALTDSSVTHADLLVLSYAPTKILAAKDTAVTGDGSIAGGSDVSAVTTGKWFQFS